MALTKVSNSMVDPTPFEVTGEGLDLNIVGAYNFTVGTDNTERLRIDSSGNVGIGLTPTYKLDVKDTSQNIFRLSTVGGSGACRLYLDNNGAGGTGYNQIWSQNNDLVFNANNAERMRINSSGNVGIATSDPAAELDMSKGADATPGKIVVKRGNNTTKISYITGYQNGTNEQGIRLAPNYYGAATTVDVEPTGLLVLNAGQLQFPATQNASSNANTLDDYEEGTFTPTTYGTTVAGTGTYAYNNGKYTKIGNTVYFTVSISQTAHTGTGFMRIAGLPFTSSLGSNVAMTVQTAFNGVTLTANYVAQGYVYHGVTYIDLQQVPVGGGVVVNISMDNNCSMIISGHYYTA